MPLPPVPDSPAASAPGFGLTLNTLGRHHPMRLHRTDCTTFERASLTRAITDVEAVEWAHEYPLSGCMRCGCRDWSLTIAKAGR